MRLIAWQIAAKDFMQGNMGNQIAPPITFGVKARRALTLVGREHLPPSVKIDVPIIEPHRPNMHGVIERRKFGGYGRPIAHTKNLPGRMRIWIRNFPRKGAKTPSSK